MTAEAQLARLRRFLLTLAAFSCAGTLVELILTEHYDKPAQFIPLVLAGLSLIALGVVLVRPRRESLLALRGIMALLVLGSLLGIYFHLQGNYAFAVEIRPNTPFTDAVVEAVTGAAPLLAPGILALTGLISIAATVGHPGLGE